MVLFSFLFFLAEHHKGLRFRSYFLVRNSPLSRNHDINTINSEILYQLRDIYLKIKCCVISKLFCNNKKSGIQIVQGRCHFQENKIPFTWNICKNMFLWNNISRVTIQISYYYNICKLRNTFHCLSVNSNRGRVW